MAMLGLDNNTHYFLKESVYFEPLINHWYAWPYMIPPVQSALYMAKKQLKIMKSFVDNPKLHAMASKHPELAGGEFLAADSDKVDLVATLLNDLKDNNQQIFQLAESISALHALLASHQDGMSMEPLYQDIPDALKGFVELCMDFNHSPSYRLIEGLLYESSWYQKSLQSLQLGLIDGKNERPFVFSTPRLTTSDTLQIAAEFTDPMVDKLFSMRTESVTGNDIHALFQGLACKGGLSLSDLFTEHPPKNRWQKTESGVKLSYLGHAGFLIEHVNTNILIDPIIANKNEQSSADVLSFADLPPSIDYICITHTHSDHANIETLIQLRHKTKTVLVPKNNGGALVDPSLKLMLNKLGFHTLELEDMEQIGLPNGEIRALPFLGEHGDLPIRSKCAWLVNLEGKNIYFGADSNNLESKMYQHVKAQIGQLDVLAIGMECVGAPFTWAYGPLVDENLSSGIKDSRRLNGSRSKQAIEMVDVFGPEQVFIYALGAEPWFKYFMGIEYTENAEQSVESQKMLDLCAERNVRCEKLFGKKVITL